MLGVLDQAKTLGLDPASPLHFAFGNNLRQMPIALLEIEPEGVATSCAFAAGQWCSLFYLFSCRSVSRSLSPLGAPSNRWLLAGVAAMIVTPAAFSCIRFMNVAFHSPPTRCRSVAAGDRCRAGRLGDCRLRKTGSHPSREKPDARHPCPRAAAASLRP
jgi:magnesium-transporting ATPase (P-type)